MYVRTSHIQVNLSKEVAFLGRKAFAEIYATTPMALTKPSEYAEVAVNHSTEVPDMISYEQIL
jgi:hypothetical protein